MTKRLLFIAPTTELKAGGEISHFELLLDAKKRGYQVHVIVRGAGTLSKNLKRNSIQYNILPFGNWAHTSQEVQTGQIDLSTALEVKKYITANKIDCVITNTLNMPWGAVGASLANIPHIWIAREFPQLEFAYLEEKYDFIKAYSNLLFANSQELTKYMCTHYGLKVHTFYSYVNANQLSLSVKKLPPRLVIVGHIYSRKNQIELIQAAGIIHKKGRLSNQILLIGGVDPTYKVKLDRLIKQLHLEKFVSFTGYRSKPFRIVSKDDIFIQTSFSESVGRSIVEAMKLGLITVGADIPGTREAFRYGGGTLYKSGDAKDLANKIEMLLANHDKYQDKALQAQKKVLERLSLPACHDTFFKKLPTVFGHNNPQKHNIQLLSHLESIDRSYRSEISQYKKMITQYKYHLDGITQSRSWRVVVKTKKMLNR